MKKMITRIQVSLFKEIFLSIELTETHWLKILNFFF